MSKQIFFSRNGAFGPDNTATTYETPTQYADWSLTAETHRKVPWRVAGTFRNLLVTVHTAPGIGKSWTITIRKNGSDTLLAATITGAATSARDITHSITIADGDELSMSIAPSGTPAAVTNGGMEISVEFSSDNAGESGYSFGGGNGAPGSVASYNGIFSQDYQFRTQIERVANVVGVAGSLKAYSATITSGQGGQSYDLYIYKSTDHGTTWVKQDGTGGTPDTHASIPSYAGAATCSASFDLPLSPGNMVYIEHTTSGVVSPYVLLGFRFLADTPGESNFCGVANDAGNNGAVNYANPGGRSFLGWTGTESDVTYVGAITAVTFSSFRLRAALAPGSSKSLNYKPQLNSADAGPSITISGTGTPVFGQDLTSTYQVLDGDTFSLAQTPTGSPTLSYISWAYGAIVGPIVVTNAATNVTTVSAQLNGTITPNGVSVDGYFLWDTVSPPTANLSSPQALGSGGVPVAYNEVITGLTPNTTYYFRAVGNDGTEDIYGEILSFNTFQLPTYESPCAVTKPMWFHVVKGQVVDDVFATYPASQKPQRDAVDSRRGGYKAPRLLSFGSIRRTASDWLTGAWQAQGLTVRRIDADRHIRRDVETDETGSLLGTHCWHFLDAEEWREQDKNPWLVFQGIVARDRMLGDLTYEHDSRDTVGAGYSMTRQESVIPSRQAWIDFGDYGYRDRGQFGISEIKVPVIAGTHSDEATTQQGRVQLLYMGTMLCGDAVTRQVGLLCGHACKDGIINAYAEGSGGSPSNRIIWGTNAFAPGKTGWAAVNPSGAALYTDLTAPSDSLVRRYTILFFDDTGGDTLGTDFASGAQAIWVNTHGFETTGDGTGGEITQLHTQILHVLQNFCGWGDDTGPDIIANPDNLWRTGLWLDTPTFEFYPGIGPLIPRFVNATFYEAASISESYTADNSQFQGAFIVGAGGTGETLRDFMQRTALSGLFQWGWNVRYSQLFIKMLDRNRDNFLANAHTVTDRTSALGRQPLRVELSDDMLVYAYLFGWDFNYRTNQFEQLDVTTAADGNVGTRFGHRFGENEGYTCISDSVTAVAVGRQRFEFRKVVRFLVTWPETLCGLEADLLGAVRMRHFAGRGSAGYVDQALWVQGHTINQDGSVDIEAYDVDDLLTS